VGTSAGVGVSSQPSQGIDSTQKSGSFLTILGTTVNAQVPPAEGIPKIEGEAALFDLRGLISLTSEIPSQGGEKVEIPSNGTTGRETDKAMSVMQLLQNLKDTLDTDNSRMGDSKRSEKPMTGNNALASEIVEMFAQSGQLPPKLEEMLKGRINPAVIERESKVEGFAKEFGTTSLGEQISGDQLAELMNEINAILTKAPRLSIDRDVDTADLTKPELLANVMQAENVLPAQASPQIIDKNVDASQVAAQKQLKAQISTAVDQDVLKVRSEFSTQLSATSIDKNVDAQAEIMEKPDTNPVIPKMSQDELKVQNELPSQTVQPSDKNVNGAGVSTEKQLKDSVIPRINLNILTAQNEILAQQHVPQLDKNMEATAAGTSKSIAASVTPQMQQNVMISQMLQNVAQLEQLLKPVQGEASATEKQDTDSEELILSDIRNTVKSEQVKAVATAGIPDLKRVEPELKELLPQTTKSQGGLLQINPSVSGAPVMDEPVTMQDQQTAKDVSLEVVVLGDESMQDATQIAANKSAPVVLEKIEPLKFETVMGGGVNGKSQQVLPDRPVAEESRTPISREEIMAQVKEKLAEHRITQDNGRITIRLNPVELGELKISVRMDDQRLRVEIVAENKNVKDALLENLGSLKESLARQNVEMKQFDVVTGSRQFFNQGFREGRTQDQQQYLAPRQTGWMTGNAADTGQAETVAWQPRSNALLDMMM
jgi:flagellar hook-length control protein FliK